MSLLITSLNSGSNGNCYYIGNEQEAVLVDAGISCRETERRMARLGLSMQQVKAIFISHEHSDHIRGVEVLARKYKLPVYITPDTLRYSRLTLDQVNIRYFQAYAPVAIGNLTITAFPKFHDASDPHSFIVTGNEVKIGVFTDIGVPCDHVISHFSQCHAAFLETNYDEDLLARGYYPQYLKNRIKGGKGHLSNRQALAMFCAYKPDFMSHVLLAHLSKDNNNPELVQELFRANADGTEVVVASRFRETPVFSISSSGGNSITPPAPARKAIPGPKAMVHQQQLSLFQDLFN